MERTLAILKPDCTRKNRIGDVLAQIEAAGFKIHALKMVRLSQGSAAAFYAVHRHQSWFGELLNFMSSGTAVPVVLEKENAVADFRTLIGATDPAEAAEGTVRARLADNKQENIVHGSDSIDNARIEIRFFFSEREIVENSANRQTS